MMESNFIALKANLGEHKMKFEIIYYDRCFEEANVIKTFLEWQNINVEMNNDFKKCLILSKGRSLPIVINTNTNEHYEGWHYFYKWFDKQGLFLC